MSPADPTTARAVQLAGRPVFTTREIATLRRASPATTSQGLARMARDGLLVRVSRGVWCSPADPRFTRFSLVAFLAGGHRAYVSFLSALHLHGMIEQIPQTIYAATTALSHVRNTAFGTYSYHRLAPAFFDGYDWYRERGSFLIATPEKALVDCFYLASRKGKRFGHLPETELGSGFSAKRARAWVDTIKDERIRESVSARLKGKT